MSEAGFSSTKNIAAKPRPSLLASKQSGIRIKSEDQLDQQISLASLAIENSNETINEGAIKNGSHLQREPQMLNSEIDTQKLNGDTKNDENKMNISKADLIRLLSMLKSELQSKEIALAAIKCEQLKRLINPVEISRSSLANTYIELQNRIKLSDRNNHNTKNNQIQISSASTGNQAIRQQQNQNFEENERESLNILNTLLELLDRHPLLALPRDSIYCLDYNCNEVSTKNYLNLKIQHLDNLINQHRRYRYHMNERLKRSEQRFLDLTRELELERHVESERERSVYRASGKAALLKHIDKLKEEIEIEKRDKQVIVMTLLNQLLDERERANNLADILSKHETNSATSMEKSSREKEKLLILETELKNLNLQVKKQSMVHTKEKEGLRSKMLDLETENARLKAKLEQMDARASPAKSGSTNPQTKENTHTSTVLRSTSGQRQAAPPTIRQTSNPITPIPGRSPSLATKPPPPARIPPSSLSSTSPSPPSRVLAHSASSNGSIQSNTASKSQPSSSSINQRSSASPLVTRILSSANAEPIRIQPLFKSASVSLTSQQVRNLKTSASTGGNMSRAPTGNQPVTKPQVPVKPAQLLDQQRNIPN